jgi:hypothetical protein
MYMLAGRHNQNCLTFVSEIRFMTTPSNEMFYSRLPVNEIPLSELLTEEHLFFNIPAGWHIIITDVKGSTAAVAGGKHETVNLVATGSIVAVLNIVYKTEITVPFFFGGDGATFIVPASILEAALQALTLHRENTKKHFGLELRVGHVPVETVLTTGHSLKITKLKTSDLFSIPVILGDGLSYAEKIIKKEDYLLNTNPPAETELDMTGMECRWDKIKPPTNYDEVVSLLVLAKDNNRQAPAFKKVVEVLNEIYGDDEKRKPITVDKLKLKATLKKISRESKTKFGGNKTGWLIKTWFKMLLGPLYFKTKSGKTYLHQLVQLSDTLVIDGRINTVISGTATQREQLLAALDELEEQNEILYGLFASGESVISCYVRNMNEKHIHFIDGSEGGYTRAAGMLKKKLAALR